MAQAQRISERPPRLRVVHAGHEVDLDAAADAVRDLLVALGHDPETEHLAGTPRRVASAYAEMLTPRPFDLTTFPNDEGYDELVLARDIPFQSLCQHHLLPFHGVAHVGYLPGDRILGLSKLARVVESFARGLQVQERLTQQVANWLDEKLTPRGVGVVLEAEHQCMSRRGVRPRDRGRSHRPCTGSCATTAAPARSSSCSPGSAGEALLGAADAHPSRPHVPGPPGMVGQTAAPAAHRLPHRRLRARRRVRRHLRHRR